MKKVNKQCLLDTPRTVRVSEKNLATKFKQEDLSSEKKISVESVQTKNIDSFMHMFNVSMHMFMHMFNVSAKYQIAPPKAVVGVDRPIKALSMHIQKPYKGISV